MTQEGTRQTTPAGASTQASRLLCRFLSNRGEGVRGLAAIEFAGIAMMLVMMAVGTADVGVGFFRKMQVQNAAQAGASYAMAHEFNAASVTRIVSAVQAATNFSGVEAAPLPYLFDGCPSTTGVISADASSKCPDGTASGAYVRISARGVYRTIVPLAAIGMPVSFTFTASSTVRVR